MQVIEEEWKLIDELCKIVKCLREKTERRDSKIMIGIIKL